MSKLLSILRWDGTGLKPGARSSEFWVTAVTLLLNNVNALPVSDKYQGWMNVIIPTAYVLSRGLAKLFPPKDESEAPATSANTFIQHPIMGAEKADAPPGMTYISSSEVSRGAITDSKLSLVKPEQDITDQEADAALDDFQPVEPSDLHVVGERDQGDSEAVKTMQRSVSR